MRILVTGATGFVGRALLPALLDAGHDVLAGTRHPDTYDGPGLPVAADVGDPEQLSAALDGCDAAYYLVHAMEGDPRGDFAARDRRSAEVFAELAAARRLKVVYLGGLDSADTVSDHLRSRLEVGRILRERAGAVELRAAVVIGAGGSSFRMLQGLVEKLPVLVAPRWVDSRCQPIALGDVVRYLAAALDLPAGHYDVAGEQVLTYEQMLLGYARIRGLRRTLVTVPWVPAGLSARGVALLSGLDLALVEPLIEGLAVDVVAADDRIRALVPFDPLDYEQSVRAALAPTTTPAAAA